MREIRHAIRMLIRNGGLSIAAILIFALGLAGNLATTRLVQTMLYDVKASDPIVVAGVVVLLVMIALAACFIPTSHATRIDPVAALRAE